MRFYKKAHVKRLIHAGFLLAAALVIGLGIFTITTLATLPSLSLLENRHITESTKIYDRTGETLLFEIFGEERRTIVPYDQIPEYVKQATVAIEDADFYNHSALDFSSLLRAVIINLRSGRYEQGGSTITQQLAKKAFLSDEKTITRKLKEAIIAYKLEQAFTKDEILALYLNQIPYGANAYGIESAAMTYFQKSITDVSLAQAAVLASLPQAPSYYSPYGSHVKELMERKETVLRRMTDQGYITEAQRKAAVAEPIVFSQLKNVRLAPHFAIQVREYLEKTYGEDFVRRSGLKVITTLDKDLQIAAEEAVAAGAARNEELYKGTNAALIAQDAKTGQILAMVGSRNYFSTSTDGAFNVATQGLRQPGSALKPFAYLAALAKGYPAETLLFDAPTEFNATGNPELNYSPQNYDGLFRGPISFRDSLAQSINVTAVKTLYLVGIDSLLETLGSFGITTLTDPRRYGLSLVLGGGEVTLEQLVGAYSVLASEGIRHNQSIILKVENREGEVLEEYTDEAERVMDDQYPRIINDMLADVKARTPLFSSSLGLTVYPGYDVALKTGTTNDYRDAWAVGYTPNLVAGVWAGNNDNTPMQKRGGSILAAVPILNAFMVKALPTRQPEAFTAPTYAVSDKPMLSGSVYAKDSDEVHDILHYVSRKDPLGPVPARPENDSQYELWEEGVKTWLKNGGSLPGKNEEQTPDSFGRITFSKPDRGEPISNTVTVDATIRMNERISLIELFFNDQIISSRTGDLGRSEVYRHTFTHDSTEQQNMLLLVATDVEGNKVSQQLLVGAVQ